MAARILIVEDEFLVSLQLEADLQSAGYTTLGPYNTLTAATQAAHDEEFDLALLDINLSGTMTFPLADALMAQETPVVFLSGYLPADLPERFRRAPQLAKPYDPAALMATLRRALSRPADSI